MKTYLQAECHSLQIILLSACSGFSYLPPTVYFTLTVSSSQSVVLLANKRGFGKFFCRTPDPCAPSLQINTLALHFLSGQRLKHKEQQATGFVCGTDLHLLIYVREKHTVFCINY